MTLSEAIKVNGRVRLSTWKHFEYIYLDETKTLFLFEDGEPAHITAPMMMAEDWVPHEGQTKECKHTNPIIILPPTFTKGKPYIFSCSKCGNRIKPTGWTLA